MSPQFFVTDRLYLLNYCQKTKTLQLQLYKNPQRKTILFLIFIAKLLQILEQFSHHTTAQTVKKIGFKYTME